MSLLWFVTYLNKSPATSYHDIPAVPSTKKTVHRPETILELALENGPSILYPRHRLPCCRIRAQLSGLHLAALPAGAGFRSCKVW